MGKAIILNSLGGGKYDIKLLFDNHTIETKKKIIQDEIIEIQLKINAQIEVVANCKNELLLASNALNDYIETINYQTDQFIADLNQLTKNNYELFAKCNIETKKLNNFKLLQTILNKDISYLEKYCPNEIQTVAWCVSYNENLTGQTKTIEIDYALSRDVLTGQIKNNTGVWIPATQNQTSTTAPDSVLQNTLATSAHATWFNLAMLPAVQRDAMRYRVATIISIDKTTNNCVVQMEGQSSIDSEKLSYLSDLPIFPGQNNNELNCSIFYPPCNAEVFESGDKVIVATNNTVIGFYSNPRKCTAPSTITGFSIWFWPVFGGQNYDQMPIKNFPNWDGIVDIDFTSALAETAFQGIVGNFYYNFGVNLTGSGDYASIQILPVSVETIITGSIVFRLIIQVSIFNGIGNPRTEYILTDSIRDCAIMTGNLSETIDGIPVTFQPTTGRVDTYWVTNQPRPANLDLTINWYYSGGSSIMHNAFVENYITDAYRSMGRLGYEPIP